MKMKRAAAVVLSLCMVLSCAISCADSAKTPETTSEAGESAGVTSSVNVSGTTSDALSSAGEQQPDAAPHDVVLSELMADNHKLCLNSGSDWVELWNRGDQEASLDGYSLTDQTDKPNRLSLKGIVIPANAYYVVLLPETGKLKLSGKGETLYLMYQGAVTDAITYTEEIGAGSWTHDGKAEYPTPGFPNTAEGYGMYLDSLPQPSGLYISEAMTSNGSYLPYDGKYYDWVELHNSGDVPVRLSDFYLSDSHKSPDAYRLPDEILEPGSYYIIYCSGLDKWGHAPFRLSSDGETLYLTRVSDGVLTDCMVLPGDIRRDQSFGRFGKRFCYMDTPTPAAVNTEGIEKSVKAPEADHVSGIYKEGFMLELSGEGNIYYTTDGTAPNETGVLYSAPLAISENTTIRAVAVSNGCYSRESSYTYLIGISHTLPVVQVSVPGAYVADAGEKSILVNYQENIEAAGHVTCFENGTELFSINCGFRLHGNGSRVGKKQSFQLRFRSEYGTGKLKCKVFDSLDIDEFQSLLLHGASEDYPCANMRDEVLETIAAGTSLYTQATKPVVLYLNNMYWGVYYIRERINDDYVASHLHVSPESVDLIESYSSAQYGSSVEYDELLQYVRTHDMTDPACLAYAEERIDSQSLMDWYIVRSFTGDKDFANIRYFRSSEFDNKWRWISFDLDWGFWHEDDQPIGDLIRDDFRNVLMWNLMKNKSFQDRFIRRYAELLQTALSEERILTIIQDYTDTIRPEMEQDRQRWGYSVSHWEGHVQRLRDYVANGKRKKAVIADIQQFFGLTDAQRIAYFGE